MELDSGAKELAAEIDKEFTAELLREEKTVEALLFTMGRSVSVEEIAIALGLGERPAEEAAERLRRRYAERAGGILIERWEGRYQMCTNPEEYDALIRVVKQPKKPVLTDVVMETLAIIAYKQPITKAEIERIRGVKSDHAVNRLVEFELVAEVGRLDAPGRPALFATTEEFLHRFGVKALAELPELSPEVEAAIAGEVSEEIADVLGSAEDTEVEPAALEDGSEELAAVSGGAEEAEIEPAASEEASERTVEALGSAEEIEAEPAALEDVSDGTANALGGIEKIDEKSVCQDTELLLEAGYSFYNEQSSDALGQEKNTVDEISESTEKEPEPVGLEDDWDDEEDDELWLERIVEELSEKEQGAVLTGLQGSNEVQPEADDDKSEPIETEYILSEPDEAPFCIESENPEKKAFTEPEYTEEANAARPES